MPTSAIRARLTATSILAAAPRPVPYDGATRATSDAIEDFTQGADQISLATMDALSARLGVQHFQFAGQTATAGVGTIRQIHDHGDTLVMANISGTNAAECSVLLAGTLALTANDFVFA